MTDKKKDVGKNVQSEIIIYQIGLHRLNYVSYIKPVNPILASILNIYLKRENWRKIQLFGNSEQLVLMARIIILHIIILI